ncbi:hypothetical protein [Pseudovibrio ascidiaceicola]|uniref:hypothetical protein n=1 Tax=Pseudovibrio ascidiaceicola TaxID=285279 RepID=UPI000D6935E3|nr:hypothetical protein [Pseudovibrio ascidiaceicola]
MTKTMWIASSHGLKIPASVLGGEKVEEFDPGEAVEVPEDYGTHLIEDGLAYEAGEPDTEPVADEGGEDAYSSMTMDQLREEAEKLDYRPPKNIGLETLREKVRDLVRAQFDELDNKAKELGITPDEDWTVEEYQAAIEAAEAQ